MLGVFALSISTLAGCAAETGDSNALPPGDPARGKIAVEAGMCRSCHGADLAGSDAPIPGSTIYSSNITPDDATGLGMWSDQEIDDALRQGKDDRGDAVCDPMPVYDNMTAQQSADMIAYLRSVPPVNRQVTESECH